MKFICDCGNEVTFEAGENPRIEDGVTQVSYDYNKMNIVAEHDEVWITCPKCNKGIHFFA